MNALAHPEQSRLALARSDLLRSQAYIGGQWVGGDHFLDVVNPATGRLLAQVPRHGAREAEKAVEAAHEAFLSWRRRSAGDRALVLKRWADLMAVHVDDLARLLTAEQGKPLAEARGEVLYAASYMEWFAEEARRVYGVTIPGHALDRRLSVIRQPVGVVAAITPWNFPVAMLARKVAPALAAGCTVVCKPSELTPLSALAFAALGEQAGAPAGVLNVLVGEAPAIGEALTSDRRVRKLSFTGSTAVGKMLAAKCAATVKRVSLELGGNAPFLVFDDADLDSAVAGAIASKFRNSGQTCVCANRFIVQAGVYDAFAEKLAAAAGRLRTGDGLETEAEQGPLIDSRATAKVWRHIDDALKRGGRLLIGGERAPESAFVQPTVIADVPGDALMCREETFGPVAGLTRFETEAEAIRLANDTDAGLAAYLFTRDASRVIRVSEALEAGMVGINTGLISTEVAPFGGVKESGTGREGSLYGIDDYVEIKALCQQVEDVEA